VLTSADGMAKGIKLHAEVQAWIEGSLAPAGAREDFRMVDERAHLANGAKKQDRNIHA